MSRNGAQYGKKEKLFEVQKIAKHKKVRDSKKLFACLKCL